MRLHLHFKNYILLLGVLWLETGALQAQEKKLLTIDSLFALAEKNSKQIGIAREQAAISAQVTAIARSERLPEINMGASLGYLSNAEVWDKHFHQPETVIMPHVSNSFSLDASMTIFGGNVLTQQIEKAKLGEQLSHLDFQKSKEDIQLLLLARYLDLFTLFNQEKIYGQNIALANSRLRNIIKLHKEGMVTNNDVIRSQLQLTDLKLRQTEITNHITIVNKDLAVILGLPDDTRIQVDTSLYKREFEDSPLQDYLDLRLSHSPELQAAKVREKIASKEVRLARAEKLPRLSVFAGDEVQRPFLYSIPPMDIYMHMFQTGLRLRYNLSSLYHAKYRIRKAEQQAHLAETQKDWELQRSEMEIHEAYIKFKEARDTYNTLNESYNLARDNYRVMEKKYLNQLAVMTDILDASTQLLSSQLNLSNARINIIYRWYNLKKVSGNLEDTLANDTSK